MGNLGSRLALVLAIAASSDASTPNPTIPPRSNVLPCALALSIEATVVAPDGGGIPGAEVWMMDRESVGPYARASRIGMTGADGRLTVRWFCSMGAGEFALWRESHQPLRLRFFVIAPGYGVAPIELSPPLDEVLAAACPIATSFRVLTAGDALDACLRTYPVKLPVSLHPVVR